MRATPRTRSILARKRKLCEALSARISITGESPCVRSSISAPPRGARTRPTSPTIVAASYRHNLRDADHRPARRRRASLPPGHRGRRRPSSSAMLDAHPPRPPPRRRDRAGRPHDRQRAASPDWSMAFRRRARVRRFLRRLDDMIEHHAPPGHRPCGCARSSTASRDCSSLNPCRRRRRRGRWRRAIASRQPSIAAISEALPPAAVVSMQVTRSVAKRAT